MRSTPWSDAHDGLLTDAAPTVAEPSDDELARIWARVATTVQSDPGPRRGRRRLRIGVAAGVGAVVLGTSGLAVAAHYSAHTGRGPIDAEDLRLGGPGEKLAMAAPDYGEVVAEETTDIPFPSDEARAFAIQDQVDDVKGAGTDEFVSTGAVRAWVADAALCSWANQWAVATRAGDETARDEAIGMVHAAPSWPAVVALGGSQFSYLEALGRAVDGRDAGAVARVLARNNGYCRPGNVPDLPAADPMSGEH